MSLVVGIVGFFNSSEQNKCPWKVDTNAFLCLSSVALSHSIERHSYPQSRKHLDKKDSSDVVPSLSMSTSIYLVDIKTMNKKVS